MDRERFTALWVRSLNAGTADDADDVFSKVLAYYSESHRRYHTPQHIDHCLRQFDLALDHVEEQDTVEMTIWFHDIIYDIPPTENELKSARLFRSMTKDRIDPTLCQNVCNMILITTHKVTPTRNDEKLLVDVDLSSFALPWEQFKKDSENVRHEFFNKSDQDFYSGHMKFMQSLLDRPSFFSSDFFREKYEANARENVQRLMEELHCAGYS